MPVSPLPTLSVPAELANRRSRSIPQLANQSQIATAPSIVHCVNEHLVRAALALPLGFLQLNFTYFFVFRLIFSRKIRIAAGVERRVGRGRAVKLQITCSVGSGTWGQRLQRRRLDVFDFGATFIGA